MVTYHETSPESRCSLRCSLRFRTISLFPLPVEAPPGQKDGIELLDRDRLTLLNGDSIGDWIETNTCRVHIFIPATISGLVLGPLESFVQFNVDSTRCLEESPLKPLLTLKNPDTLIWIDSLHIALPVRRFGRVLMKEYR